MTPDEALAEYHRVIAEYDTAHPPECPVDKRMREKAAERRQRRVGELNSEDRAIIK
jgi:hypothetical protein